MRAYKYRIYPSRAQKTRLANWLALCCELYNAGLQERRDAYRITRKTVAYKDQQNRLPEIKRIRPELSTIHSQVLQDVLRRPDKAFDAFFRRDEKQLAKAQKKQSAATKSSRERKKRRKVVAQVHERIANRRRDFAHQVSRKLVNRFAIIVFEDLNISGMLKNHCLAKSISDAAWNQLVRFTSYKAENAGGCVVQVNSRNTSQICCGCGEIVNKDLRIRVHSCPNCGLMMHRDHNAAINILALGLQSVGQQTIEAVAI